MTAGVWDMMLPKDQRYKNKKIRDSANGEDCTMHSMHCNHNPKTTVWAHSNRMEHGKAGKLKAHDIHGAYLCSGCHDYYDGRIRCMGTRADRELGFDRARDKSLLILIRKGVLK